MSDEEDSGRSPINVEAVVSDDKRSLMLRLGDGKDAPCLAAVDTVSVDSLIASLGKARSEMLEPVPFNRNGTFPIDAYDPHWRICPDSDNKFATFWIRHPGFGWSIYGFPRNEAGNIAKWLRQITMITSTRDTQSPQASSFGGDTFLLTTEGLGFYYYGKGENRIGPNPFEQVEFDSDRAAGIVAGSIAEIRLEQALRSRLRTEPPQIASDLFRPSGALGPFKIKIDLAYLMGMLSEEAFKDLTVIKNIRNDFAHKLELDLFERPSIRDRCKNLLLVDRHVGPIPDHTNINLESLKDSPKSYLGLPDHEQKLADPRFRYVMTAQLISSELGMASDNPDAPLPFV